MHDGKEACWFSVIGSRFSVIGHRISVIGWIQSKDIGNKMSQRLEGLAGLTRSNLSYKSIDKMAVVN